MQEFRSEVEQFCRDVFADAGLPDPFSFIHPAGKFTPLDGKDVIARGLDYIKSRFALGYQLEAMHYLLSMSPGEDHTELWYAARLAAEFTTLDLLVTRLRANDGAPEELLMYAAQTGAEIGRLDKERRLKFAHEPDAIRGEDFDPKRPRRKTGRSPNKHKKTRDENIVERARVFLRMNKGRFASSGLINISNLADLVITSLKPDIKATRVKEILREAIRDRKLTD